MQDSSFLREGTPTRARAHVCKRYFLRNKTQSAETRNSTTSKYCRTVAFWGRDPHELGHVVCKRYFSTKTKHNLQKLGKVQQANIAFMRVGPPRASLGCANVQCCSSRSVWLKRPSWNILDFVFRVFVFRIFVFWFCLSICVCHLFYLPFSLT